MFFSSDVHNGIHFLVVFHTPKKHKKTQHNYCTDVAMEPSSPSSKRRKVEGFEGAKFQRFSALKSLDALNVFEIVDWVQTFLADTVGGVWLFIYLYYNVYRPKHPNISVFHVEDI